MDIRTPNDAEIAAYQEQAIRLRAEAIRQVGMAFAAWVRRVFHGAPKAAASALSEGKQSRPA